MGALGILEWIRQWIGGRAWRLFLWSLRLTEDEYFTQIYLEEKQHREIGGRPL